MVSRSIFLSAPLMMLLTQFALGGTVLHRPSEAEPDTLDPQKTSSDESIAIDRDMFTGLLALDAHRHPIPGVATSWETSPDGKVWTFHLRPDARWSNGEPVTADDFVYSFRRLVDPATAASDTSDLNEVVNGKAIVAGREKDLSKLGVAAIDPHTLKIELERPRASFLYLLTDCQLFPLPQAAIVKWGDAWVKPEHIVSNGPYRMKAWVPESDIILEKNPTFFEAGDVRIDEVHWLDAEDAAASVRRYEAKELDFIDLSRTELRWAKTNRRRELQTAPADELALLAINMKSGQLSSDIRLREALNLAIDRDQLVQQVDARGETAAYGVVSPLVSAYQPQSMDFKSLSAIERMAKAKALVSAAGYGPSKPFKVIVIYPGGASSKSILLALAQMVRPAGIELKLDNMEWQVFVDRMNQRDYELCFMNTVNPYDDFESALGLFSREAGSYNPSGYSNPAFEAIFTEIKTETDPSKRLTLGEQAERLLLGDYPFVPLEFEVHNRLVAPGLVGMADDVAFPQSRYLAFKAEPGR